MVLRFRIMMQEFLSFLLPISGLPEQSDCMLIYDMKVWSIMPIYVANTELARKLMITIRSKGN